MSFRWLPNAISILRIVLVLPVVLYIIQGRYDVALGLFFLAAFSDGVDGYLAKRFNWHSHLGALLDPIADKMLVGGTFLALVYVALIPVWLAVLVILRDIVIVGGATVYNFLIRPVEGVPTRISKLNTGLQLVFVVFVLARAGFDWPDRITITVIGAGVVVTVIISGIDYVWFWARRARAPQTRHPDGIES